MIKANRDLLGNGNRGKDRLEISDISSGSSFYLKVVDKNFSEQAPSRAQSYYEETVLFPGTARILSRNFCLLAQSPCFGRIEKAPVCPLEKG